MTWRASLFLTTRVLLGCGKIASEDASGVGTHPAMEAGTDSAVAAPGASDEADAFAGFDGFSMTDAAVGIGDGACAPYWCGCGTCPSAEIICTSKPPACALGCPSDCATLATATCKTEEQAGAAQRCFRVGFDAGRGQACLRDEDCPFNECCPIANAQYSHCVAQSGGACGGR